MRRAIIIFLVQAVLVAGAHSQIQHVLESSNIAKPDTVWVFVPSDYQGNAAGTYPVVYLLNGWSGTYHQWNDIMGCQAYADRYQFIIVCPDGLYDSWYINSPAVGKSRFADFFYSDLMPFIGGKYRVRPENIFITGLSMGGYGAFRLFAERPDLFRSAGSISGLLDLSGHWNEYGIQRYLGIKDQESGKSVLDKFSVLAGIGKIARAGKPVIFSCGTSDPFYSINTAFRLKCEELKIDATCITSPGGHDYGYWKSAIGFHFDFFSRLVKNP
jgi:S-formylglutathione hydrolase FrmB